MCGENIDSKAVGRFSKGIFLIYYQGESRQGGIMDNIKPFPNDDSGYRNGRQVDTSAEGNITRLGSKNQKIKKIHVSG